MWVKRYLCLNACGYTHVLPCWGGLSLQPGVFLHSSFTLFSEDVSQQNSGLPSHLALRILLSPPSKDGVTGSSHPQHLQTFRRSKLPASGLAYVSAAVAAESSPLCSLKINKNKQTKTRIITMRIISVKYVKYLKEKWIPRSCL